ncbi:radical SAM protein [Anaerocolumna sp. AGMB13025]|uniref:radical SAM protein n=1 Tax=Anaerocolumna sp. AGMB13025 TaxID=3039116 RepID=UPI00241FA459|nr:radical SAM protein [Anaerocolumna sp. AGMB13025]WFR56533.1 radical SAM protein [Anaerocolumna sp. AGMB13025]
MHLTWDITTRCNLRCKHCGAISLVEQNKPEYKNWKKVIDYVSTFVDHMTLLGGEPLLHPEIEEIIHYACSYGIKVSLITNGQAEGSLVDAIMKHPIASIFVSMEGLLDSHDQVRGTGTWKKAMDTLKHLTYLNKYKSPRTQIGVNIVANKLNRHEILDFMESTKELGIRYQISSLALKGNADINQDLLAISTGEVLDLFEEIAQYHAGNPGMKINILNDYPIFKEYLNKKYGTDYRIKGFTCDALTGAIYADPNGNISTCQNHSDMKLNMEEYHDWNEDFPVFEPFLQLLHKKNTNTVCTPCKYKDVCIPCPYNSSPELPEFCIEVMNRTSSLTLPLQAKFRLNKPYSIIESENRYEIVYPNLGLNTEYTTEGIKILKAIREYKTLKEIAEEVIFPPEVVYEFLSQEKKSLKVTELRTI